MTFKINSVEIDHIGVLDQASFDFSEDPSGVVSIYGSNRTGKTSFITAIQAVVRHFKGEKLDDLTPLLSEGVENGSVVLSGSYEGQDWKVSVTIEKVDYGITSYQEVSLSDGLSMEQLVQLVTQRIIVLPHISTDVLHLSPLSETFSRLLNQTSDNTLAIEMIGSTLIFPNNFLAILTEFENLANDLLEELIPDMSIQLVYGHRGMQLVVNTIGPLGESSQLYDGESTGTKYLVNLLSTLATIKTEGRIVFIDDLGSRLGPDWLDKIIDYFSEDKRGQLIFTSYRPIESPIVSPTENPTSGGLLQLSLE